MSIKRYLVAGGAAALVFGGVYGSAAALDVDGGNAQAGQDYTLSCDTDGVKVEGYFIEQNESGIEPASYGVVVSGIDANCDGLYLSARVFDNNQSDPTVLANGVVQIDADGTARVDWSTGDLEDSVAVSEIGGVSLAIT